MFLEIVLPRSKNDGIHRAVGENVGLVYSPHMAHDGFRSLTEDAREFGFALVQVQNGLLPRVAVRERKPEKIAVFLYHVLRLKKNSEVEIQAVTVT